MLLRLCRHLLLALALLAIVPATASAACGDTVIDDYLDDGRVDGQYTQACYDEALNSLDDDLREYTNAEQDIRSAKQRARSDARPATTQTPAETQLPPPPAQPQPSEDDDDGGAPSPSTSPSPSEEDGSAGVTPPSGDDGDDEDRTGSGGPGADDEFPAGSEEAAAQADEGGSIDDRLVDTGGVLGVETDVAESADVTSNGPLQQALRDVGPSGGNDLPVPVLVLGGLAILLIAVGAGGIVLRRLQSR